MATVFYNVIKAQLLTGGISLENDDIKMALVTSSYTPDVDGDAIYTDISNEVSGGGYTAGGEDVTGGTVAQDNTGNRGVLDFDDVVWTGVTLTARGAVLYLDTGTPSTSLLIAYIDFGSDKSVTSGTFTVGWDAAGVITQN